MRNKIIRPEAIMDEIHEIIWILKADGIENQCKLHNAFSMAWKSIFIMAIFHDKSSNDSSKMNRGDNGSN